LRLLKATAAFEGGVDYILWKIERHSGITADIEPRLKRRPLYATMASVTLINPEMTMLCGNFKDLLFYKACILTSAVGALYGSLPVFCSCCFSQ